MLSFLSRLCGCTRDPPQDFGVARLVKDQKPAFRTLGWRI